MNDSNDIQHAELGHELTPPFKIGDRVRRKNRDIVQEFVVERCYRVVDNGRTRWVVDNETTLGRAWADDVELVPANSPESPESPDGSSGSAEAEVNPLKLDHDEARWIRRKLKLPAEASSSDVYGQMHVMESNAHGYTTYIAAYRCDDKQGEIARLTVEVARLQKLYDQESADHTGTIEHRDAHEQSLNGLFCSLGMDEEQRAWTSHHNPVAEAEEFVGRLREHEAIVKAINELRAEEGSSVSIMCDNPDFNGQPNNAVECCGDWTDWDDRRFTGDTLLAALQAAVAAKGGAA